MYLRRKILVKAKRLSTCATGNNNDNECKSDDKHDESKKKENKAK